MVKNYKKYLNENFGPSEHDAIGFPSGEIITIPQQKIKPLVQMDLIQYLEYIRLESGNIIRKKYIFQDHNYDNIIKILKNKQKEDTVGNASILQIAEKTGKPYDKIIELRCDYIQLTNLNGIENLTNLKILICSNNQLKSLEGIEKLTNLEMLYCQNNQLTSLEGIENLTNLKLLWCVNNQLTNLDEIEKLINLKYLSCSNNLFSNDYKKMLKNYCKNKNIELNI